MENFILECCVDSVESAIKAQEGGANRLELCGNLIIGGTSPSIALYEEVRKHTNIRIHALLRPRFGDFLYTDHEMEILRREVALFREAGCDGVVIGCLTEEGELNMPGMQMLLAERGNMSVTLHRAFDVAKDPFKVLEQCKELGINTILTSGQKNSVLEGADLICQLVEKAEGKVDILAGAGVNAAVIEKMLAKTPLTSFHMSGKVTLDSGMKYRKEGVSMGLPSLSEFEVWQTDPAKVRAARTVLENA
ncbi:MAG: copper homeostasis protein CutC [Lachnospiraceae bacterium]|nr:copper homeostasis protein CutC [Lachnospiraceae bacterium]